jgi:hypothetical protein
LTSLDPAAEATPYDSPPEIAVAAIAGYKGPVLVDFDETLYLRNSTEDFIDSAYPALLAAIVLRVLDVVGPWRWSGGVETRDVWRVRAISLLFPWTWVIWRRRLAELARLYTNESLATAVRAATRTPFIVTLGFTSIIEPLARAMDLSGAHLVGARLGTFRDRRAGKLALATAALGSATVECSLVLTDSPGDLDLLDACRLPLRTIWPGATFRRALSRAYLPGQYIVQVKHPGARYVSRGILQEDFLLWLLCSIGLGSTVVPHTLGILLLLVSFWVVYEQGYIDNDLIEARYERPLVKPGRRFPTAPRRFKPWIWATGTGAIALALLRWPALPSGRDFVSWGVVLLLTHSWFRLYTRLDKKTRVWLYFGLQLARSGAFVVVAPISSIGAAAIAATVFAKWVPYFSYRRAEQRWVNDSTMVVRLHFFVILSVLLAATEGWHVIVNWTALGLVAWCAFRARHELRSVLLTATRIDRTIERAS